jgi:SAM-dependent methyltransferase
VLGDGNALPLRDATFDLVTYAQSWHWTDPARSIPEAARVLHDRGVLAVFWNLLMADGIDWWDRFTKSLERLGVSYDRRSRNADFGAELEESGVFRWVRGVEIPWTREVPVTAFVVDYSSHSYVADLAASDQASVLGQLRDDLTNVYPDGVARLPYITRLWVARR